MEGLEHFLSQDASPDDFLASLDLLTARDPMSIMSVEQQQDLRMYFASAPSSEAGPHLVQSVGIQQPQAGGDGAAAPSAVAQNQQAEQLAMPEVTMQAAVDPQKPRANGKAASKPRAATQTVAPAPGQQTSKGAISGVKKPAKKRDEAAKSRYAIWTALSVQEHFRVLNFRITCQNGEFCFTSHLQAQGGAQEGRACSARGYSDGKDVPVVCTYCGERASEAVREFLDSMVCSAAPVHDLAPCINDVFGHA